MSSNQEIIRSIYKSWKEDTRAVLSKANELEFHYTKKILSRYINRDASVIELGCATGYYGMFFADKCRKYTGIDITPEHIDIFNEKIKNAGLTNVSAHTGDATSLDGIQAESYDVVLCLGPMYHLPPAERELVFSECKRILRPGGIAAFAYISPMGAYLKAVMSWPDKYPSEEANDCVLKKGRDDLRPDVFFYITPEHISRRAEERGFTVIKNVGVDFSVNDGIINGMDENKYKAFITLNDYITEHESCAGLANHSLLICKK